MAESEDYEVGYGKPPKQHQFKPGQSGNPKGRPKKNKNVTALFREELERKITVTENGVSRKLTKREAMVRQLVNSGLNGSVSDKIRLMKLLDTFLPSETEAEPTGTQKIIVEVVDPNHPPDLLERAANSMAAEVEGAGQADN